MDLKNPVVSNAEMFRYLGVALTRVLLASRGVKTRKPILVVCLTNHALDSFLADIRDAGILTFARVGSMSKESWTGEYDLKMLTRKLKKTTFERTSSQSAHHQVEGSSPHSHRDVILNSAGLWTEGVSWCESLNTSTLSWPAVREYLKHGDPAALACFVDIENTDQTRLADIRLARKVGGFAFEFWCSVSKALTRISFSFATHLGQSMIDCTLNLLRADMTESNCFLQPSVCCRRMNEAG